MVTYCPGRVTEHPKCKSMGGFNHPYGSLCRNPEKFHSRTHLCESRPEDRDEEPHIDEGEEVLADGGVRHLEDGVAELEGGEEEGELGHLAEVVGRDAVPRGARLAPRAEAPRQRGVQPAQARRQNLGTRCRSISQLQCLYRGLSKRKKVSLP